MKPVAYDNPGPITAPPTFTTATLLANAEWVSAAFPVPGLTQINGSVVADQPGTLYIEQSEDRVNWDISTYYEIIPNDGKGFHFKTLLTYMRVRYVNGAIPQNAFRLYFLFK